MVGSLAKVTSHLGDTWSFPGQEKPLCPMQRVPHWLYGLPPRWPAALSLILSPEQKVHPRVSLPLPRNPRAFS